MPQLSRPLQVALAAVALLAVVWFVALRGHSSSSESTASTPVTSTAAAASTSTTPAAASSSSSSPGSPSSVYHGSAPGVEGLTRDIQKAHAAVAQSEQNAAQLEHKSAQASGESSSRTTRSGGTSAAAGTGSTTHRSANASPAKAAPVHAKAPAHKPASPTHAVRGTTGQTWVEGELAKKTTVALLFYSPHSSDDLLVRSELQHVIAAERGRHVKIALRLATGEQVGEYGSFTRVASVYETPTLLLITPSGEVKPPITGLTDAYSIEQAIAEKTQP